MPDKFTTLTPELHRYVVRQGAREDALLRRLREETERLHPDRAIMQVAPDQGALMTLLARAVGARRALEVGTFTGYSAICLARGLAPDGVLVTCELSEEYAATARRWFDEAGLADRIDLRVGPALETLRSLRGKEPFDLAFIDADKVGYPDYYEQALALSRTGGLVMLDNVLLGGRVLAPAGDESAQVMAALNERLAGDERVDLAMIAVSDGITMARKR